MAEAFVFNMDAVVTKDYFKEVLDARLSALEAKLGGELRLHRWMLAIVIASSVIPLLQQFYSGL
jgi:hypothetical protein